MFCERGPTESVRSGEERGPRDQVDVNAVFVQNLAVVWGGREQAGVG